ACARCRLAGRLRFRGAVGSASAAIVSCRPHGVGRLLLDTTPLTGLPNPDTEERFFLGEELARAAQAAVKVAVLAHPMYIDPQLFGTTVARNRGLITSAFTSEAEAIAGLLDANAP